MRLFIAINFNNEIKNNLCESIESLKSFSLKGNYTVRDNLHLTLVFIGETNDEQKVIRVMDSIKSQPFNLKIGGIGSFKRLGGDIYWMGVKKNSQLMSLQKQLSSELVKSGFDIEKREYKPHLTLGRRVILKDYNAYIKAPDCSVLVDNISLMKSESIMGELRYTEIYKKFL